MAKGFHFTYLFCNDLEKMKKFYSEILHLELIWEDSQTIAYKIGEHQLAICLDKSVTSFSSEFSQQLGWQGGTAPRISWSLECDLQDFQEIVTSVQANLEVPRKFSQPKWVGYWSFPLLDPMNHTIEVTCVEKEDFYE